MKQLLKTICLLILLVCCLSVSVWANEPTFDFQITADGKTEKTVSCGDIITVNFILCRTDQNQPYAMYAMQNEICYDGEFFRLVEGSVQAENNVQTKDIALRNHYRAFYMNTLSLGKDTLWNPSVLVGSFQLEVVGTSGVTVISCNDPKVSKQNGSGSYSLQTNQIVVSINQDCTVVFESDGGSAVETQTVKRGHSIQQPVDPTRTGYRFDGWYKDIDRQIPWDFAKDTVDSNLHLYAKWIKDTTVSKYLDVTTSDWFFGDVQYVSANGLMDGVGDGMFAPLQNTSRAMIVTILWRLEGKPLSESQMSFADVLYGQWYTEAIRWASEKGIGNGYSAQNFGPNDTITREQMAAILYRYASAKGYDTTLQADLSKFSDSNAVSSWARDAMAWANAQALINGMPVNLLAPQGQANRCQTAAILHRFCLKY